MTNPAVIARMAAAVREAVDHIARHIEAACQPAFRAYGDYFTRLKEAPAVIVLLFSRLTVLSNLVDGQLDADARERIAVMEMRDGFLTAETVEKLRPRLPGLGELADPTRVTPKDLFGLLTVETLCDLVQTRLTDPRA